MRHGNPIETSSTAQSALKIHSVSVMPVITELTAQCYLLDHRGAVLSEAGIKSIWKWLLSGIGIFQIGDQIVEVDANKDPTLIIIPGNTPHQILNEKDEPLMFFYYFPGFHSISRFNSHVTSSAGRLSRKRSRAC